MQISTDHLMNSCCLGCWHKSRWICNETKSIFGLENLIVFIHSLSVKFLSPSMHLSTERDSLQVGESVLRKSARGYRGKQSRSIIAIVVHHAIKTLSRNQLRELYLVEGGWSI